MSISSPVHHVINVSGEHTQLDKSSSANLMHDTSENLRNTVGFNAENDGELIKLEQAATKAQAAFRGYLVGFFSMFNLNKKLSFFTCLYDVLRVATFFCEGLKLFLTKYM